MATAETAEDLLNRLPESLGENNEYIRRIMVLDNFVVIEYSKRQLFIRHIHPNSFSSEEVEENLLFDVIAPTVAEAVTKMELKVKSFEDSVD
ncbi:hypothetical protein [Rhodohalobacter mucosus]|uniref:Uncharacterized protein n=1 Tax=Rhodohalobacter mucosus TaxID=2079485 RepID=A0A316TQ53_9BACT|nr:hypothetical protein [Rhodohalobacter mucosus]PWN05938.1 hypothetical protein DDZ15_12195 [Rhodohalobacter mucosus]